MEGTLRPAHRGGGVGLQHLQAAVEGANSGDRKDGSIFSLEAGRPWQCHHLGNRHRGRRLCRGFAVGSVVFRKDLSSPERTKQLLFQGAQACRDHIWGERCPIIHLPESLKPGLVGAPQAARGQMLIGPDGRLIRCPAQASEAGEWRPAVLAGYHT